MKLNDLQLIITKYNNTLQHDDCMFSSKVYRCYITIAALSTRPLKRVAEPIDVANTIYFLSNNKLSNHITGQIIMCDGGMEDRVKNVDKWYKGEIQ